MSLTHLAHGYSQVTQKVILTVGLLAAYRVLVHTTVLPIDTNVYVHLLNSSYWVRVAYSMHSVKALENFSPVTLGILPYLMSTAWITPSYNSLIREVGESPSAQKTRDFCLSVSTAVVAMLLSWLLFSYALRANIW